jgi:hypothetical protein
MRLCSVCAHIRTRKGEGEASWNLPRKPFAFSIPFQPSSVQSLQQEPLTEPLMTWLPTTHSHLSRTSLHVADQTESSPPTSTALVSTFSFMGSSLNSDIGIRQIPKLHRFIQSQSRRSCSIEVNCQSDFHFAAHCNAVIFDATVHHVC